MTTPARISGTRGELDIQITGNNRAVHELLRRMETGFSPLGMAGFLGTVVGPYLQQRAKMRFKNEGDDTVGQWLPLSASTQNIRANGPWSVGPAHPINVRTHEMERYVTGSAGDALPLGLMAELTFPDPKRGRGGELQKKMRTAQRGATQKGRKATPPRPVIGLGMTDFTFVVAQLALYAKAVGKGKANP